MIRAQLEDTERKHTTEAAKAYIVEMEKTDRGSHEKMTFGLPL
jgi:hypothetical protein